MSTDPIETILQQYVERAEKDGSVTTVGKLRIYSIGSKDYRGRTPRFRIGTGMVSRADALAYLKAVQP